MHSPVIADMTSTGLLQIAGPDGIEDFLARPGLCLLFFAGGRQHSRETHDVAVALREMLKEYPAQLHAALIEHDDQLRERFRVINTPSLVFVVGGKVQEVLPGVRDWSDYSAAFARYLGPHTTNSREARA
jgi:hypothetical protein